MPHSLRARLSGLRYKKIISDKDYNRLCKALDNENVLDKIRTIVDEWNANTWTDNLSYECMIKIAELVEPKESEDKK